MEINKPSSKQQTKRETAQAHNELYEQGKQKKYPHVKKEAQTSTRNAIAIAANRASATPGRSNAGRRMRNRVADRMKKQMAGRDKISKLFLRAGINTGL